MFQKNANYFDIDLNWVETGDPEHPYQTQKFGHSLKIRLNDFPDEAMFTLLVDESSVKDFDDWPPNWKR